MAFEGGDGRRRLVTAGLLVAPLVVVVALTALTSRRDLSIFGSDLETYRGYAERLLAGATPYRGFALEYPPLALIPMAVPALVAAAVRRRSGRVCGRLRRGPGAHRRAGGLAHPPRRSATDRRARHVDGPGHRRRRLRRLALRPVAGGDDPRRRRRDPTGAAGTRRRRARRRDGDEALPDRRPPDTRRAGGRPRRPARPPPPRRGYRRGAGGGGRGDRPRGGWRWPAAARLPARPRPPARERRLGVAPPRPRPRRPARRDRPRVRFAPGDRTGRRHPGRGQLVRRGDPRGRR